MDVGHRGAKIVVLSKDRIIRNVSVTHEFYRMDKIIMGTLGELKKDKEIIPELLKLNPSYAHNIITVEDPVESPIKDINQVQVNAQVGLEFSAALRSILRHDPDIIFIGEIRDNETAQIAVRSSITGHLVLSTLHTNDALSAVMRLCDMGVEKYLVTSSLSGVVAQRLLKRVCPECSEDHEITDEESRLTGLPRGTVTKVGRGCMNCGNTGYSGRIAIYEFVLVTKELRKAILSGATMDELLDVAKEQGMISLKDSCKELLLNGITSCKEAVRVIYAKE